MTSSNSNYVFTSESVSEGHPDKVCDQISDAILDSLLAQDPKSRVACETLVKNDYVVLAGEITSNGKIEYDNVARQTIKNIGYDDPEIGFSASSCQIVKYINAQSADISMGVSEGEGAFLDQGAGDQGIMFGFACNETKELMPMPIAFSHRILQELTNVRKLKQVNFLRPDAKSQVTIQYENNRPVRVDTIVLSTQHTESATQKEIEELVREQIVPAVVPAEYLTKDTRYFINPTGRFVIGGPVGDCGLTGRKIIVDTYGGFGRHGGGAFSGKDPSKVDRSAAYVARYVAKNIVASGVAERCEIQLAYAIGVAEPVSIRVETFGTGKVAEDQIVAAIRESFDLTPKGIITSLNLLQPMYQQTAAYGHFGRPGTDNSFTWEKTDKVEAFKKLL